ncbi:hypothetical protein ACET3Z_007057 [Daucus carota]
MDTADQWPQEGAPPSDHKKVKPQKDEAPLNCPRCHSTNTKFCYFNNYSLTQPRHFCKACRRYWTRGGSLRNVPVGGGSRKNKRSNSLVTKPTESQDDHLSSHFSFQNPSNLNLAFSQDYNTLEASRLNNKDINNNIIQLNLNSSYSTSSPSTSASLSAMELLKLNSTGFSHTFVPVVQNPGMMMQYSSGFQFQEFNKPQLGFAANNQQNVMSGAADQRLNFPFGGASSKHHTNGVDNEDNKVEGNSSVYWNGMSSGGSW